MKQKGSKTLVAGFAVFSVLISASEARAATRTLANTIATLKQTPQIEAIYQLHRNLRTTDKDNTTAGYIANEEESCQGNYIKLAVEPDARSYTVSIPALHISRRYRTRQASR